MPDHIGDTLCSHILFSSLLFGHNMKIFQKEHSSMYALGCLCYMVIRQHVSMSSISNSGSFNVALLKLRALKLFFCIFNALSFSSDVESAAFPFWMLSAKMRKKKIQQVKKKSLVSLHVVFCFQRREIRNALPQEEG